MNKKDIKIIVKEELKTIEDTKKKKKKEEREELVAVAGLVIATLFIFAVVSFISYDLGKETAQNEIIDKVNEFGNVEMYDKDNQLIITLEKYHTCINWGKYPYFNLLSNSSLITWGNLSSSLK